uniref:Variant surface glycoprotein 1125.2601 n=1 Tax=Trypanosoma brucei TaxID=5691 RepID=A0A1J0R8B6_9TRYP|nr:variant surface glycoprotein 1125.2601 [Trypanosoma brucei]
MTPTDNSAKIVAESPGKELFSGVSTEKLDQILEVYRKQQKAAHKKRNLRKFFHRPDNAAATEKISVIFALLTTKEAALAAAVRTKEQKVQLLRKKARHDILQALYGEDWKNVKQATDENADKPIANPTDHRKLPFAAGGRNAHCKPNVATKNTAADALVADLFCLCTGGNADNTEGKKHCSDEEINGITPINSETARQHAHASYIALWKACPFKRTAATLTELAQLLANKKDTLLATMGTNIITTSNAAAGATELKHTKAFLGMCPPTGNSRSDTTDNDETEQRSATRGVCIEYTREKQPPDGIKWVGAIDQPVAKLTTANHMYNELAQNIDELRGIEKQMQTLLLMGDSLSTPIAALSDTGKKEATVKQQNKCKSATNKTVEGCADIDCGYDSDKKECKAKQGEGETNAGTGDTTKD